MTKGAITTLTRSLELSLAKNKSGIRVNAVAPGPIWTPLIPSSFEKSEIPQFGSTTALGRAGQMVECTGSYVFLASEVASYITGQTIHINGELSDVYIEVDKNTGNIVGAFDSMNGTVGGYTEDMSKKIKELSKTNESTLNTLKSNIGDASNIWVDKSRNIVNANGDVISSLKDVKLKSDGTKEALIDIDGRSFKIEVDT